jgi:hypothetical protein
MITQTCILSSNNVSFTEIIPVKWRTVALAKPLMAVTLLAALN